MKFEDVENARQAYVMKLRKVRWKLFAVICGGLVLAVGLAYLTGVRVLGIDGSLVVAGAMIAMSVVFLIDGLTGILVKDELYNYRKVYKGYFVEKQLASFVTDLDYRHNAGLDRQILSLTGMIDTGDRYSSNDLTRGKYNGVNFMQADVHIQKEYRDDRGNKHYRTIFKGRFLVFDFPKEFKYRMVMAHKKIPTYYVNPKTGKGLKVVKTESESFNKRFVVQAEDEFEAFYILNPVFIENIEKLGEQHNDKVSVYFARSQMLVGINDGNDIFEPPNSRKAINEQLEMEKVTGEMSLITKVVDDLRLRK